MAVLERDRERRGQETKDGGERFRGESKDREVRTKLKRKEMR